MIFMCDKIKEFYEKHLKGQNELQIIIFIDLINFRVSLV